MSRLRVYDASTGEVRYDTDGTVAGRDEGVRERVEAGVRFLADAPSGRVECVFTTSGSARFVARYESSTRGSGLLRECKWEVESALDELGIELADSSPWFRGLGDTGAVTPDGLARLRTLRRQVHSDPPYEYSVPSAAVSIQVTKALLSSADLRVVAGSDLARSDHGSADVTLAVDESTDGIEATGETLRDIRRYELANLTENARTQAKKLREEVPEGRAPGQWVASALEGAGFGATGIVVSPSETRGHRQRIQTLSVLLGCAVAVLLGLVVALRAGRMGRLAELLTRSYALSELVGPLSSANPIPGTSAPVPALVPVGLPVLLALPFLGSRLQGIERRLRPSTDNSPRSDHAAGLKQVVIEMRSHPLVSDDEELRQTLREDVLGTEGIEVKLAAEARSERRLFIGSRVLAGAVIGGVVAVALYYSPAVLGRYWEAVTSLSYGVLGVVFAYYVYRALRVVVSVSTESEVPQQGKRGRRGPETTNRREGGQAGQYPETSNRMGAGEVVVGTLVLLPLLFGPVHAAMSWPGSDSLNALATESIAPALVAAIWAGAAGFVYLEWRSKTSDVESGAAVRAAVLFVLGNGVSILGYGLAGLLSVPPLAGAVAVMVGMVSFLTLYVRYDSFKIGVLVSTLAGVEMILVAVVLTLV